MSKQQPAQEPAKDDPRCPISFALDLFGDRWSLRLVRDMLLFGKSRYGEMLNSSTGISTNILADRLKHLQQLMLVEKYPDPDNKKTAIYLLTDKGVALYPVLIEIIRWGLEHDGHSMVNEEMKHVLDTGSDQMISEIKARIHEQRQRLIAAGA